MAAQHWLVKSEPGAYSWDRFAADRGTRWDGVRNPSARNHLAAMRRGDLALFYHSGDAKAVVGVARVRRTAYPDPTADDPRWLAVDLEPLEPLARAVTLREMKADRALAGLPLFRQPRLSVVPLAKREYERILELSRRESP
jgi:predicted RNA-binding protein with PUA-like domain